jgi:hypothetical protein
MTSTTSFLVLIGIITANQAVLRIAGLRGSPWIFWGLQSVNLGFICYIFTAGLPGFEASPMISYAIGLIFTLRVIQNNGLRAKLLRENVKKRRDAQRPEVDALVERLKESEKEPQ